MGFNLRSVLPQLLAPAIAWAEQQARQVEREGEPLDATGLALEIQSSWLDQREPPSLRMLSGSEAEAEGWFKGPPYAVAESVFDEYDAQGCSLEPEAVLGPATNGTQ